MVNNVEKAELEIVVKTFDMASDELKELSRIVKDYRVTKLETNPNQLTSKSQGAKVLRSPSPIPPGPNWLYSKDNPFPIWLEAIPGNGWTEILKQLGWYIAGKIVLDPIYDAVAPKVSSFLDDALSTAFGYQELSPLNFPTSTPDPNQVPNQTGTPDPFPTEEFKPMPVPVPPGEFGQTMSGQGFNAWGERYQALADAYAVDDLASSAEDFLGISTYVSDSWAEIKAGIIGANDEGLAPLTESAKKLQDTMRSYAADDAIGLVVKGIIPAATESAPPRPTRRKPRQSKDERLEDFLLADEPPIPAYSPRSYTPAQEEACSASRALLAGPRAARSLIWPLSVKLAPS